MNGISQDVRFACRMWRRRPGFAALAILTLAIGIAAVTTMFGIVDALVWRPLPFKHSGRLVTLWSVDVRSPDARYGPSIADFRDWAAGAGSFERMAQFRETAFLPAVETDGPALIRALETSPDLFDALSVHPSIGRVWEPSDQVADTPHLAIISDGLWRSQFAAAADVVGRKFRVRVPATRDPIALTVVGVMPPRFDFPYGRGVQMWLPATVSQSERDARMYRGPWSAIARLKTGVSLEGARAEMEMWASRLAAAHPESNRGVATQVVPLIDTILGSGVRGSLYVLFGAVLCLLLIACLNVANLLLTRAANRRRELAVRASLGAGRARLARQMLTESVLTSALACVAGLLLTRWTLAGVLTIMPPEIGRVDEIAMDGRVLAFAVAAAFVTAFLSGVAPAFSLIRHELGGILKAHGGIGTRRAARASSMLLATEVGCSALLMLCAGLLIRSFVATVSVDPGFDASGLIDLRVTSTVRDATGRLTLTSLLPRYQELLQSVSALPGVEAVSGTDSSPFAGFTTLYRLQVPGNDAASDTPFVEFRRVMPGFFEMMKMRLVQGRDLDRGDTASSPPVAVLNEAAARLYFSGGSPVGRDIVTGVSYEVVGIVASAKQLSLTDPPRPAMYVSYLQNPRPSMTVLARAPRSGRTVVAALRQLDIPGFRLDAPTFVADRIAETVRHPRFRALLVGTFGALALVLSAVGMFGVVSAAVARRTREFGIRLAIGARPGQIVSLVLRQALMPLIVGAGAGLACALLVRRIVAAFLFGISPEDVITWMAVPTVLAAVAAVACALPARRASRLNPVIALRDD